MKLWVGITDRDWFEQLRLQGPDEANFWQPSGRQPYRLQPGEPFLFKLHSPHDFIVGGGFFVRFTAVPISLAWEAFGSRNGVSGLLELRERINRYRAGNIATNPVIGCNILAEPFFWPEAAWIRVPEGWKRNIVQGKSYDTGDTVGAALWREVRDRVSSLASIPPTVLEIDQIDRARFGAQYLAHARLGQGAFRMLVTDAYHRRCAITGERTLPALEAAHIKPYAMEGPHRVSNGLLIRSDVHRLFDLGYITVTPEMRIEVSRRIREEYENGREYYRYHGNALLEQPEHSMERPGRMFLEWHNENVFRS